MSPPLPIEHRPGTGGRRPAGRRPAFDRLVDRYRRFVRSRCRGFFLVGGDSQDLEQEALIGFYKSVRDFDPTREASFRSFAELCIHRQILSAVKAAARDRHKSLGRMSMDPGDSGIMATLQARGVTHAFGPAVVLADVDVTVSPGQRIGVVGPNGTGKSTLLRILAGNVVPESGVVSTAPPAATVGLLPQEPDRRPDETVAEFVGRRTGVAAASLELDQATSDLAAAGPAPMTATPTPSTGGWRWAPPISTPAWAPPLPTSACPVRWPTSPPRPSREARPPG